MSIRLTRFRRIVLVITVTALVLGLWHFTDSLRGGGSWLLGKQHGTHDAQPDAAELRLGRKRERLADSSDLTHMKERWKAMAPSMRQTGQVSAEDMLARKQLARESVQRLLCGSETLELVKFIEELEIPFGGNYLDEAVEELMRSPRAVEARASLLSVQDGPKIEAGNHLDGLLFHLDSWCFEAGKGCSDEEFEQFFAAMKDEKSKFNAMLGRNLTMADTDAQQAVSSTLQILKDHADLRTSYVSLSGQVKKLRQDSDFKEIETLFPVENGENRTDYSPIWSAYNEVFKKWAAKDPAEAANYVMENPERTGDDKISVIAGVVARKDPLAALEWVQNFPEGPYFDKAASGIISSLNNAYPKEALDLAALIGDPKLREEAISNTKIKQQHAEQKEKTRADSKGANR